MITLSQDQMLAQWKARHFLEPIRTDCSEVRTSGIDIDYVLKLEIRDWYLNLLDTGDAKMLPITDLALETAAMKRPDSGAVVGKLPESCRRVLAVRIKGCEQDIIPYTDVNCYEVSLQRSEYSRGGAYEPVAVLGMGNNLTVYAHDAAGNPPEIEHIYAVVLPEDGTYTFDESAHSTIPTVKI